MKKYILITLAFIFLLSGVCFSQSSIGKRFRKNYAYKSFNKPYVSYTLERIHYSKKDTNTFHTNVYINRNNKEPILYTVSNSEYAMRLTYDDFTWINSTTEEIMYYLAPKKNEPSMYQAMLSTLYSHLSKDLCAFAFIDDDRDIRIQRIIQDTIIEGKRYDILFGKTCTFISTNHKGESTKYYNEIEILFNKEIDFIESVKWQEMKLDGTPMYDKDEYAICRYTNLSFENKDTEFVNIFNENNPVYTIFEHCNDTNPSKAYVVKGKEFTVLTNEILEWNLVNSDKDTTNLKNENSWILLVTWYEGCSACKTWIANYTKEKKEKGFSELEKNGIKVICINPFAKDFSRMRKTEELLNAKGLLYSANGLHKVIDMYRFPSYYLISPNKEIVFSTSSIIKDNQIFVEEMQKHLH